RSGRRCGLPPRVLQLAAAVVAHRIAPLPCGSPGGSACHHSRTTPLGMQRSLLRWQGGGMDEETQATMAAVGPRLRGLRTQRGLALTALAEAAGISLSTLSRLEAGLRRPTLELLLPLARELRVDIGLLIGAPQTGDPRLHLPPVTRRGMTMLPHARRAGSLPAHKLIISPTTTTHEPDQTSPEGHEALPA